MSTKPLLTWTVQPGPSGVMVELRGEIDMSSYEGLRDTLVGLIDHEEERHLRVHLAGVTFMDSTGISVFVAVHRRLVEVDGRLTICHVPAKFRRIFDVAGVRSLFAVSDDHGDHDVPNAV